MLHAIYVMFEGEMTAITALQRQIHNCFAPHSNSSGIVPHTYTSMANKQHKHTRKAEDEGKALMAQNIFSHILGWPMDIYILIWSVLCAIHTMYTLQIIHQPSLFLISKNWMTYSRWKRLCVHSYTLYAMLACIMMVNIDTRAHTQIIFTIQSFKNGLKISIPMTLFFFCFLLPHNLCFIF